MCIISKVAYQNKALSMQMKVYIVAFKFFFPELETFNSGLDSLSSFTYLFRRTFNL